MGGEALDAHRRARREAWRQRTCAVCNIKVHIESVILDYMATDEVWAAAGFGPKDLACLGCFEQRLGRYITLDDLTNAIINRLLRLAIVAGFTPWRKKDLGSDS